MTTAHRPTWAPAMGGEEQGGNRMVAGSRMMSAKDQPGYRTMKQRKVGQNAASELADRDLLSELEAKERKHFKLDKLEEFESMHPDTGVLSYAYVHATSALEARQEDLKLLQATSDVPGRAKMLVPRAQDADEEDSDVEESSESDDDDDDDMEALQAELDRIKQERKLENEKAEAAEREKVEKEAREKLMKDNPALREQLGLPAEEPSFGVKRRWDDDVVFKNQARNEPKHAKRFINDTVRSDFHRRFLDRYVR